MLMNISISIDVRDSVPAAAGFRISDNLRDVDFHQYDSPKDTVQIFIKYKHTKINSK